MKKFLFLVRHAETEEPESGQRDSERRLTTTGTRDSWHMGKYLADQKILPDLIVASTASRALETAEIIAQQMKYEYSRIKEVEDIYEAPIRLLLEIVNKTEESISSLMLVGHNPGISYLAEYLTNEEIGTVAPGGVIAIAFEGEWQAFSSGACNLDFYKHPAVVD